MLNCHDNIDCKAGRRQNETSRRAAHRRLPAPSKAPSISRASPRDSEKFTILERTCYSSDYENSLFTKLDFQHFLSQPRAIAYLATIDAEPVGYVLGRVRGGGLSHVGRIEGLAVDPFSRRRGIGSRLMNVCLQAIKRRRCRFVSLETTVRNRSAIKLFKSIGFRVFRQLPDYYGPGKDAVRMRLDMCAWSSS